MIPKKIHWCWLSGEPIPPFLENCMATWKKVMPEYEVKLWTKVLPWDIKDVCEDTIAIHCGFGNWVDNNTKWHILMQNLKQFRLTSKLYELVKYRRKV